MHTLLTSPDYWLGVASGVGLLAGAGAFLILAVRREPAAHARRLAEGIEFEAEVARERARIRRQGLSPRQRAAATAAARRAERRGCPLRRAIAWR
jgi:hypothetical protein